MNGWSVDLIILITFPRIFKRVNCVPNSNIYKELVAEWVGDGGRVQLSLVRGFRTGEDIRANRLPAMSEGLGDIWGQVLYCVFGLVRFGKYN